MNPNDVGARLRAHREALGLSLEDLARRTRVQPRILDAIERNDLPQIPPSPYGRGFIRAYAREVGLEPDDAVREYFGQFPPPPRPPEVEPEPWPRQTSWILPASGVLVAALVLGAMVKGGSEAPPAGDVPAPVGTAGADTLERAGIPALGNESVAEPLQTAGHAAAAAETHQQDPRDPSSEFSVRIVADRVCWIAARADGTRVLYELLQPGAEHTITATRDVLLRAGDAGAIRVALNGEEANVFGRDGEVRTARITASGVSPRAVPAAR